MSILHTHQITTTSDVIGTTELGVHFFKQRLLSLRDEEVDLSNEDEQIVFATNKAIRLTNTASRKLIPANM